MPVKITKSSTKSCALKAPLHYKMGLGEVNDINFSKSLFKLI